MGQAVRIRRVEGRSCGADKNITQERDNSNARRRTEHAEHIAATGEGPCRRQSPKYSANPQTQSQAQPAGRYAAAFRLAPVALLLTKVGNATGLDSSTAECFAATINQFKGKVTMLFSQKDIDIDGKRISLSPGMNITAEIKTGQRRVTEYLLSLSGAKGGGVKG